MTLQTKGLCFLFETSAIKTVGLGQGLHQGSTLETPIVDWSQTNFYTK